MIFFRTSLIVILVSITQILISADEELVVTGSYLKDRTIESSPVDIFNAVELENLNISLLQKLANIFIPHQGLIFKVIL